MFQTACIVKLNDIKIPVPIDIILNNCNRQQVTTKKNIKKRTDTKLIPGTLQVITSTSATSDAYSSPLSSNSNSRWRVYFILSIIVWRWGPVSIRKWSGRRKWTHGDMAASCGVMRWSTDKWKWGVWHRWHELWRWWQWCRIGGAGGWWWMIVAGWWQAIITRRWRLGVIRLWFSDRRLGWLCLGQNWPGTPSGQDSSNSYSILQCRSISEMINRVIKYLLQVGLQPPDELLVGQGCLYNHHQGLLQNRILCLATLYALSCVSMLGESWTLKNKPNLNMCMRRERRTM